jgi:hypothetical protein
VQEPDVGDEEVQSSIVVEDRREVVVAKEYSELARRNALVEGD